MTRQATISTQRAEQRSEAAAMPARDVSGYAIFADGEAGEAHVMAHRFVDQSRVTAGRHWLGEWLGSHDGSGSDWLHLQFHMALFELGDGDWTAAHTRYLEKILPAAAGTDLALTDAPALAWRLALSAPHPVHLAWDVLRGTALDNLESATTPFVELHNLLAIAGAEDVASIERWLEQARRAEPSFIATTLLCNMADALIAWCQHRYAVAARKLGAVVPRLPQLGGSHAQSQLFLELERAARHRAALTEPALTFAAAA